MTDNQLIQKTALGDKEAESLFLDCYSAIVFRIIRPFLGDQSRSGEAAERFLVEYIAKIQADPANAGTYSELLDGARLFAMDRLSPQPGNGLSHKQQAVLKFLNDLSSSERMIAELGLVMDVADEEICLRLEIDAKSLDTVRADILHKFNKLHPVKKEAKHGSFQQYKRRYSGPPKRQGFDPRSRNEGPNRRDDRRYR
jgi:hypothetical protein